MQSARAGGYLLIFARANGLIAVDEAPTLEKAQAMAAAMMVEPAVAERLFIAQVVEIRHRTRGAK